MKYAVGMIALLAVVLAALWFFLDGPSTSAGPAPAGRPNAQDIRDLKIN